VTIASSTTEWILALAAIASVVVAIGGIVATWRKRTKSHPSPLSADQAAAEKRNAYAQFDGTLLEIAEVAKQFDPSRPSAADDVKTIRGLSQTLARNGKGEMERAFDEQSAVVEIEREIRYAVIRTIDIFERRLSPRATNGSGAGGDAPPWLVLEHARDLLRTNVDAALKRPRDVLTEVENPYALDELLTFAAPAH
jgi:hypothetical protein